MQGRGIGLTIVLFDLNVSKRWAHTEKRYRTQQKVCAWWNECLRERGRKHGHRSITRWWAKNWLWVVSFRWRTSITRFEIRHECCIQLNEWNNGAHSCLFSFSLFCLVQQTFYFLGDKLPFLPIFLCNAHPFPFFVLFSSSSLIITLPAFTLLLFY